MYPSMVSSSPPLKQTTGNLATERMTCLSMLSLHKYPDKAPRDEGNVAGLVVIKGGKVCGILGHPAIEFCLDCPYKVLEGLTPIWNRLTRR